MKIFTCRVKHGVQYGWGLQVGGCPCPTLTSMVIKNAFTPDTAQPYVLESNP